jgi:hypothetical protein
VLSVALALTKFQLLALTRIGSMSLDQSPDPLDSCCFSFVAKSFVTCLPNGVIQSEKHVFAGYLWQLEVIPYGYSKPRRASLFLYCTKQAEGSGIESPAKIPFSVRSLVSVVHPSNERIVIQRELDQTIDEGFDFKQRIGWESFARLADLKEDGFISADGSLKVGVKLTFISKGSVVASPEFNCGATGRNRASYAMMLRNPDKSHADIRLQGREHDAPIIRAHRSVLCTSYDFFSAMFSGDYKEDSSNIVRFDDISGEALRIVIEYAYGIDLPFHVKDDDVLLKDLWQFAAVRLMDDLRDECSCVVRDSLNETNFIDSFRLAIQLNDEEAIEHMSTKLLSFGRSSKAYDDALNLEGDELQTLLKDMPANFETLELVQNWLGQDENLFQKHAKSLFDAFQLDDMAVTDLQQCDRYAFARDYISSQCYFRMAQKLSSGTKSGKAAAANSAKA